MKKIMLAVAMLLSVFMSAQESFPAKHPELLKGKDVKVIATHEAEISGYSGFYSDRDLRKTYMPSKKRYDTETGALLEKQFKVVEVDSLINPYQKMCRITLAGSDGTNIYYKYDGAFDIDYPFEVIGGLALPEGFYCNYITKEDYGTYVKYTALVTRGTWLTKRVEAGKASYSMSFAVFGDKDSTDMITKVTLALENDKTIVDNNQKIFAEFISATSFKYSFTTILSAAQIQLLAQNKLIGIKAGPLVLPFEKATKLQGIVKCMQNLK